MENLDEIDVLSFSTHLEALHEYDAALFNKEHQNILFSLQRNNSYSTEKRSFILSLFRDEFSRERLEKESKSDSFKINVLEIFQENKILSLSSSFVDCVYENAVEAYITSGTTNILMQNKLVFKDFFCVHKEEIVKNFGFIKMNRTNENSNFSSVLGQIRYNKKHLNVAFRKEVEKKRKLFQSEKLMQKGGAEVPFIAAQYFLLERFENTPEKLINLYDEKVIDPKFDKNNALIELLVSKFPSLAKTTTALEIAKGMRDRAKKQIKQKDLNS